MSDAPVLSRFIRHRPAVGSVLVIALLGFGAVFAGGLRLPDPIRIEMAHRFAPPLAKGHVLGADELGRDVLSRLLHAGRISLTVGVAAMLVTVTFAAFVRPSLVSMTLIIGVTSWMDVTRMVRAQILALREREFVLGARGLGASGE